MAYKLRKAEIVKALTEAGVNVDDNLTLVQLRPLYNQTFAHLPRDQQPGPAILANRDTGEADEEKIEVNTVATAAPTGMGSSNNTEAQNGQRQQNDTITQRPNANPGEIDGADLDAQIEIMRKKIELQRLMTELNQVQHRRFEYSHFEGMVQKFTGDDAYDVNKWIRDLERALEMFRCSENEKLMAAMRKIGGTAATFMR